MERGGLKIKEQKMRKTKKGTINGGYLPNMQVFYSGGIPNLVKVKPAKNSVQFHRNIKHCKFGDEGECASCANAVAGMDAGVGKLCISNDATFIAIHKWVRTKKMSYGIGTIYRSDQGKFQRRFDADKEGLLASGDAEGTVVLHPYTRHKQGSRSGPSGPSGQGGGGPQKTVMRTRTSPKGARRRAARSGLGLLAKGLE
jgi:hypothetical protein